MGRKKEPPRMAVRLTESEKKKIEAAAAKCGLTPGEKRNAMFWLPARAFDGIMTMMDSISKSKPSYIVFTERSRNESHKDIFVRHQKEDPFF
ncbi:MAG: hypothetical protein II191_01825 [Clostridia bacterium]|nr:hypothetical protein [Clostridia bacterium]